ncbi:MAG: hypothetical protein ACTSXL_02200 [Alphaproteobacteria bacterium]
MRRLFLSFIVFSMFSVCAIAQTDPFVMQMQINSTQNNINALKAENQSLQAELDGLETKLKKKKTGMGLAIGAGVLGVGFGAWGVNKGIKANRKYKVKDAELKKLKGGT